MFYVRYVGIEGRYLDIPNGICHRYISMSVGTKGVFYIILG